MKTLTAGGLVPFSTVDWPGKLAAVVFCQGCPWRCRYCHNTHLQPFDKKPSFQITWQEICHNLGRRRGLLDGVVFSGGEPTAQRGLLRAMHEVRQMGFGVALHTAGIHPKRLARLLPEVDWVGLDIKAPFDERYDRVTGRPGSAGVVVESLRILMASKVDYELRTTVHPLLLDQDARKAIDHQLMAMGAKATRWQDFRTAGCKDEELNVAV